MASEDETPAPALTADALRAKLRPAAKRLEAVETPLGVVYVRELSALERDRLDDAMTDDKGTHLADDQRAKVFCACACDPLGAPLFALTPKDVTEVSGWPVSVVEPVYAAALALNFPRRRDKAAAKKD